MVVMALPLPGHEPAGTAESAQAGEARGVDL
ncbi:hypothetical protein FHW94_001644 [Novosphingobium sp. SG720]|nr:hypothetical protein [Novosphingobium sp. SG720]